jgi:hypothetical protein
MFLNKGKRKIEKGDRILMVVGQYRTRYGFVTRFSTTRISAYILLDGETREKCLRLTSMQVVIDELPENDFDTALLVGIDLVLEQLLRLDLNDLEIHSMFDRRLGIIRDDMNTSQASES